MDAENLLVKLGQRIIQLRNEKGMKQIDLAINSNMDDSSLRKIETGKINPTAKTLQKIAIGLEISIKDLFDF
jgi:transcriptional regulator with XRE-family HTH domain